jgi:hypothetical protein
MIEEGYLRSRGIEAGVRIVRSDEVLAGIGRATAV